ncbi:hypothetical protein CAEBREN_23021 [Caenorhabditis brenneri]|uniref:Homeobox domain-containing protein n=1 Tax=Caenorhabditis brenneri TaxID=135651 RepID=G0NL67_CAEBE|nr:hypothetical protein CAEBREN_23021 [Caenorhabditis brenneri]
MDDSPKTPRQKMWEQLKKSPNVLKDYYYVFRNRWIGRNRNMLMELTGLTERQIKDTLQAFRSKDSFELSTPQHTPEQKRILTEAFEDFCYLNSERITELAKKTGLLPQQVATWFSRERRTRDGTIGQKRKKPDASCDEEDVSEDTKPKKLYFSIENILSDDFPQKKE